MRRNAVYALLPQADGTIGADSRVDLVVGDGTGSFLAPVGERYPGVKLPVREPLGVSVGEDGVVLVVTSYGAATYDPLAREAEWLVLWEGIDELPLNPARVAVSAQALNAASFVIRQDPSPSFFLARIDVDRMSSERDPTRTLVKTATGLELLDTTRALREVFDGAGRLVERRKRTGELVMAVTYADARTDRVDHVTDAAGGQTMFAYDGSGKLASITDARGRTTRISVNDLGDVTSIQQPDGETYHFTYAEHRMTEKRSPRGDLTTYAYRADGTVQTLTKAGGATTTVDAALSHPATFDASGKLVRAGSYTDAHGVVHQVELDAFGGIAKDSYVADGVSRVEQAVYATDVFDEAHPQETARLNRPLRVAYRTLNGIPTGPSLDRWDAHYRPARQHSTLYDLDTHAWGYTPDGWLEYETVGQAAWSTVYQRDAAGHVTSQYLSTLAFVGDQRTFPVSGPSTDTTYRADGQPATITEHDVTRTFTYDDAGGTLNELGWTDSIGRQMTYTLDAYGNTIASTDGTATTHATYDANNRVIETRDALGNATTYGYETAGCGCSQENLVTSIHTPDLPAGVDWTMTYDPDGRLATVTDPQGFTESYAYEPTGELKKLTDKLLRDTTWSHDQLGRALAMVDTLGRRHDSVYAVPTTTGWDGPTMTAGSGDATAAVTDLLSSLRSGDYQIGQNAYPKEGYPAAIPLYRDATFELSFSRRFDQNRRMLSRFARDGLSVATTQESTTSAFWSDQSSYNAYTAAPVKVTMSALRPPGIDSAQYSQDGWFDRVYDTGFWSGNEARVNETLTRDTAGRVTQLQRDFSGWSTGGPQPYALNVLSTYTYRPDGRLGQLVNPDGTHDFTYDSRGLMETQTVSGEGTYSYGYDELGRNSQLTYPDGHVRRQRYDELGRIIERCYDYSLGTTRCYTASYDAVGNPVRMTDPDGVDVLEYDALDRLTKVTRYQPDGVTVTGVEDYAYNALGALKLNAGIALDDQRPRLDGAGTADAAVPASLDGAPVTLDAGGRVTSMRGTSLTWSEAGPLREAQDPVPAELEHYGFDADLRRISRQQGATTEFYVYEGLDRVATIAPGGAVSETYLFDGIDHPLRVHLASSNTTAYYELDLAGNVRGLRASGGADLGGYRYTAFGTTVEDTAAIDQPLRWKARWFSSVAGGIYDVRARQWAPDAGVFLVVDEYWAHDATGTLWSWPNQNAPRYSDPSGRLAPAGVAAAAAAGLSGGPLVAAGLGGGAVIFGEVALALYGGYKVYQHFYPPAGGPPAPLRDPLVS